MARTNRAAGLAPYAQELLANEYVQDQLRDGVANLRAAYERARKRRVEPTRDERLRRQLRSAAESLTEAGRALRSGRRKPKPRWGPRVAVIAGLGIAGAAAGIWAKQRLTERPGPAPAPGPSDDGADRAAQPTVA